MPDAATTEPVSLYRRYRPGRFSELVGQDSIAAALRQMVAADEVGHAYLFCGPRGCGKTSSARILAKALNCDAPEDGEPCDRCEPCRAISAGRSLDVIEFDAASNSGVDAIRDVLRSVALATPGRRKVYIVDEVHQLSAAASNALLKTLEEPPAHVVWVLATTESHRVLPTVRSRCQTLDFRLVPADRLRKHLDEIVADAGLQVDDATLDSVCRRAEGSVRDALSILETAARGVDPGHDHALALAVDLIGDQTDRPLATIATAIGAGADPRRLAEETVAVLRDAFLCQMGADGLASVPSSTGFTALQDAGARSVVAAIEALGDALVAMRQGFDARVSLEIATVRSIARRAK